MDRRRSPFALGFFSGMVAAMLLAGCVHRMPNPALRETDPTTGYYFHTHTRPNNSADTMFILCFSGGGTRAAALTCGVLEELGTYVTEPALLSNRLLDEVDAISSVSGGSVTAAAYGLYGEQAFERLNRSFLKQNVQRELVGRVLNPFRWNKLFSKTYGRSDLAADLYDEILFHGATFADLARQSGAFTCINATDVSTGARFSFTQYQFNLICADLAPYRVAQAVAASSAVPGLLSPITINSYADHCDSFLATSVAEALATGSEDVVSRARFHFLEMATYINRTNNSYVHLLDGGVSDNLGIRAVLDGIYTVQSIPAARQRVSIEGIERVAIVVVNAYSKPETGWASREQPPGTLALSLASAAIPMDRYSYETIELLKEQVERWREQQKAARGEAAGARSEIRFYPVVVSFEDLVEPKERSYFLNLPTSFFLSDESVDRLRDVGGRLLRQSKAFQGFVGDLEGHPPAGPSLQ